MIYSTKAFMYDKATNHFTAETSDLGCGEIFGWVPGVNNAGISVRSHRTGRVVRFMIVNRRVGEDGTLWWDLIPVHQDQVALNIADVTMRIYND